MATAYDYKEVLRVVTDLGSNQWDLIGVELGLSQAKIGSLTSRSTTDAGKLRAIVDNLKETLGTPELIKQLLDACSRLPSPIRRGVEEELEKSGNTKQTSEEIKTSSHSPGPAAGKTLDDIIEAVVDHGADKWSQIGRRMGFPAADVTASTATMVTPREKLEHLIDLKRVELGDENFRVLIFQVCEKVKIAGGVKDQLGMK